MLGFGAVKCRASGSEKVKVEEWENHLLKAMEEVEEEEGEKVRFSFL